MEVNFHCSHRQMPLRNDKQRMQGSSGMIYNQSAPGINKLKKYNNTITFIGDGLTASSQYDTNQF